MKNKWKKLRITNFVKNFSTIKKNTHNIFKFINVMNGHQNLPKYCHFLNWVILLTPLGFTKDKVSFFFWKPNNW